MTTPCRALSAAMLAAVLLVLLACEPGDGYTIANRSDETVVLVTNGVAQTTLAPGEEISYFMVQDALVPSRFEVLSEAGELLREFEVRWEDVAGGDFVIEVP
jgi:hypothetical protein